MNTHPRAHASAPPQPASPPVGQATAMHGCGSRSALPHKLPAQVSASPRRRPHHGRLRQRSQAQRPPRRSFRWRMRLCCDAPVPARKAVQCWGQSRRRARRRGFAVAPGLHQDGFTRSYIESNPGHCVDGPADRRASSPPGHQGPACQGGLYRPQAATAQHGARLGSSGRRSRQPSRDTSRTSASQPTLP